MNSNLLITTAVLLLSNTVLLVAVQPHEALPKYDYPRVIDFPDVRPLNYDAQSPRYRLLHEDGERHEYFIGSRNLLQRYKWDYERAEFSVNTILNVTADPRYGNDKSVSILNTCRVAEEEAQGFICDARYVGDYIAVNITHSVVCVQSFGTVTCDLYAWNYNRDKLELARELDKTFGLVMSPKTPNDFLRTKFCDPNDAETKENRFLSIVEKEPHGRFLMSIPKHNLVQYHAFRQGMQNDITTINAKSFYMGRRVDAPAAFDFGEGKVAFVTSVSTTDMKAYTVREGFYIPQVIHVCAGEVGFKKGFSTFFKANIFCGQRAGRPTLSERGVMPGLYLEKVLAVSTSDDADDVYITFAGPDYMPAMTAVCRYSKADLRRLFDEAPYRHGFMRARSSQTDNAAEWYDFSAINVTEDFPRWQSEERSNSANRRFSQRNAALQVSEYAESTSLDQTTRFSPCRCPEHDGGREDDPRRIYHLDSGIALTREMWMPKNDLPNGETNSEPIFLNALNYTVTAMAVERDAYSIDQNDAQINRSTIVYLATTEGMIIKLIQGTTTSKTKIASIIREKRALATEPRSQPSRPATTELSKLRIVPATTGHGGATLLIVSPYGAVVSRRTADYCAARSASCRQCRVDGQCFWADGRCRLIDSAETAERALNIIRGEGCPMPTAPTAAVKTDIIYTGADENSQDESAAIVGSDDIIESQPVSGENSAEDESGLSVAFWWVIPGIIGVAVVLILGIVAGFVLRPRLERCMPTGAANFQSPFHKRRAPVFLSNQHSTTPHAVNGGNGAVVGDVTGAKAAGNFQTHTQSTPSTTETAGSDNSSSRGGGETSPSPYIDLKPPPAVESARVKPQPALYTTIRGPLRRGESRDDSATLRYHSQYDTDDGYHHQLHHSTFQPQLSSVGVTRKPSDAFRQTAGFQTLAARQQPYFSSGPTPSSTQHQTAFSTKTLGRPTRLSGLTSLDGTIVDPAMQTRYCGVDVFPTPLTASNVGDVTVDHRFPVDETMIGAKVAPPRKKAVVAVEQLSDGGGGGRSGVGMTRSTFEGVNLARSSTNGSFTNV